jgi:hypothetical protein
VWVTQVSDGTTVTLYYYNDKWVISTHRGYAVNEYVWAANKTYQQVVDEVFAQYSINYDVFDKNKSYTIGFNHYDFHPFQAENKKIKAWFIQSVDLKKFNSGDEKYACYNEKIGLPLQKYIKFNNLRQAFAAAKNAYTDYVNDGTVNYGYLVKVGLKRYLIESSLLRHIRHIFYSNKFNNLDTGFDKRNYIIVHSFLHSQHHTIFQNLFPQFKQSFANLHTTMHNLVNLVYKMLKNNDIVANSTAETVAKELAKQIPKTVNFDGKNKQVVITILYSYLCSTKYTNMLYKLTYLHQ